MKTEIPFLEALRSDLLEHAPIDVRASRAAARRARGPLIAVAAFALVIVVGGMAWLLRGDRVLDDGDVGGPDLIEWDLRVIVEPTNDPEALVADVYAIPGVVEVQYVPDTGTRSVGVLVRVERGADLAVVAARLRAWHDVADVAYSEEADARFGDDFLSVATRGASFIAADPLILRPGLGPEPQFDPSSLGREVVLDDPVSTEELIERVSRPISALGELTWQRDESQPFLFIGYLAEIDSDLVLQASVVTNVYCDRVRGGATCGSMTADGYGVVHGGGDLETQYAVVRVPVETSVVTLLLHNGEPMWQRPRAGFALFPADVYGTDNSEVRAYDALGDEIGVWELTTPIAVP
jgi:hypothetical protein